MAYITQLRAMHVSPTEGLALLALAPDVEPDPEDRLPEESRRGDTPSWCHQDIRTDVACSFVPTISPRHSQCHHFLRSIATLITASRLGPSPLARISNQETTINTCANYEKLKEGCVA